MNIVLGQMTSPISGDITQLNAIILADARRTEANLGFHLGRLSGGYKILVLNRRPQASDFEFSGTTLRSGGREGLPADTDEKDKDRMRIHDGIMGARGADGYAAMQQAALQNIQVKGPQRLVKIMPDIRHNTDMSPSQQYPMGGGFLQWTLKKPGLSFFCAAQVAKDGLVSVPGQTFQLNSGNFANDYPQRAEFQKYLQQA